MPASPGALRDPRLDANGRIDEDITCVQCGYNLRTLLLDAACPECNTDVRTSTSNYLLRLGDPGWVRRIARGIRWIIFSIGLMAIAALVNIVLFTLAQAGWVHHAHVSGTWFQVSLLAAALASAGCWLMTSPQPDPPADAHRLAGRKATRILLAWPPLAIALGMNLYAYQEFILAAVRRLGLSDVWSVVLIVTPVTVAYAFMASWLAALHLYMWSLTLRIPDGALAWRTRALMWTWALLGLPWLAYPVLLAASLRTAPALVATWAGIAGPMTILALLWSVKVLARMHVRLQEVARQIETR